MRDVSSSSSDTVSVPGRSLLWVNDTTSVLDEEDNTYPNASICPSMFLNQSESIRLDTQLRGWFSGSSSREFKVNGLGSLDLGELNYADIKASVGGPPAPTSPPRTRRRPAEAAERRETSLGAYKKPRSLTGGMYHMIISEQEERAAAARDSANTNLCVFKSF